MPERREIRATYNSRLLVTPQEFIKQTLEEIFTIRSFKQKLCLLVHGSELKTSDVTNSSLLGNETFSRAPIMDFIDIITDEDLTFMTMPDPIIENDDYVLIDEMGIQEIAHGVNKFSTICITVIAYNRTYHSELCRFTTGFRFDDLTSSNEHSVDRMFEGLAEIHTSYICSKCLWDGFDNPPIIEMDFVFNSDGYDFFEERWDIDIMHHYKKTATVSVSTSREGEMEIEYLNRHFIDSEGFLLKTVEDLFSLRTIAYAYDLTDNILDETERTVMLDDLLVHVDQKELLEELKHSGESYITFLIKVTYCKKGIYKTHQLQERIDYNLDILHFDNAEFLNTAAAERAKLNFNAIWAKHGGFLQDPNVYISTIRAEIIIG